MSIYQGHLESNAHSSILFYTMIGEKKIIVANSPPTRGSHPPQRAITPHRTITPRMTPHKKNSPPMTQKLLNDAKQAYFSTKSCFQMPKSTKKSIQYMYISLLGPRHHRCGSPIVITLSVCPFVCLSVRLSKLCCNAITRTVFDLQTSYFIHRWRIKKGRRL